MTIFLGYKRCDYTVLHYQRYWPTNQSNNTINKKCNVRNSPAHARILRRGRSVGGKGYSDT